MSLYPSLEDMTVGKMAKVLLEISLVYVVFVDTDLFYAFNTDSCQSANLLKKLMTTCCFGKICVCESICS